MGKILLRLVALASAVCGMALSGGAGVRPF
jgi:hypothetical protein